MAPGIYTLLLRLDRSSEINVGSLGWISFLKGYYSYTGSARGPAGLKRIERHLAVMKGTNLTRQWHIDYLLPYTSLEGVVVTHTSQNLECKIARRIGAERYYIPNFGSTDCECPSHLHYSSDLKRLLNIVSLAHDYSY